MKATSRYSKLHSQAEKIIWITLFWTVIAVLKFLGGYSTLIELNCNLTGLSAFMFFKGSLVTGISAGLLGGSLIVFFWEK